MGFLCLKPRDTFAKLISGHSTVRTAGIRTMVLQLLYAQGYVPPVRARDVERSYCAFTNIPCTSCSVCSLASKLHGLPSQHTCTCVPKPHLLPKDIFSPGLPTCPCKISRNLRKGCVLVVYIKRSIKGGDTLPLLCCYETPTCAASALELESLH